MLTALKLLGILPLSASMSILQSVAT